MFSTRCIPLAMVVGLMAACSTPHSPELVSDRKIVGPETYTVDWDVPETGAYWVPKDRENDTATASDHCKAAISVFIYHHVPVPPQFSHIGFRFEGVSNDAARSCLIARLNAVPALTIYPKSK